MKILGCIREIQTTELVINLPNSLNGYVPITSIHDVMNDQLLKSMNDDKDDEDEVSPKYVPKMSPHSFCVLRILYCLVMEFTLVVLLGKRVFPAVPWLNIDISSHPALQDQ